ncbi:conserved hypothetical protein [Escherichia coli APEC O1]|uniref:Uncharacterized protein n=1 Tax=Escherichia coli O1:K1 / APEC TaxID=405955 RepID=A0A0H2Z5T3_ECOK1|nr:conserved hypothetical protein [Escherichia coli APEC O1]
MFTPENLVFIFRLATLRIRIFECPHRFSDKLLKSSCDAAFSSLSRGGVYYAFLFQSQPLNFRIFLFNRTGCLCEVIHIRRVDGGAL